VTDQAFLSISDTENQEVERKPFPRHYRKHGLQDAARVSNTLSIITIPEWNQVAFIIESRHR
jgi:hypothetical protein